MAKSDGCRHGTIDDEGEEHAGRILGRGGEHGCVHLEPVAHQGPGREDPM